MKGVRRAAAGVRLDGFEYDKGKQRDQVEGVSRIE